MKIALVVSDYNSDVTALMLERAREHAASLGVEVSHVVHVPGVYDMGPMIKKLILRDDVDGVVMIGAVIKGETLHDEVIVHATARIGAELAVQYDKPVALGVTGPGMTLMQALDRVNNARNAVESVVRMARALKDLTD